VQGVAAVMAGILVGAYLCWKWCSFGLRWGSDGLFAPFMVACALTQFMSVGVPAFILGPLCWHVWALYMDIRAEPGRGVFRLPQWPRAPRMRGPGGRGARVFRQPMPWTAGPTSF
jgi:hypothetical protein